MAREPHKPPAATYWLNYSAIPVFVTAFVVLGDVQTPMRPGPPHGVAVASENTLDQEQVSLAPTPVASTKKQPLTGNPLWAVPLSALSVTVARPVFSPSRRPPPPPVVAARSVPPTKPLPPPPTQPDHPLLTLLGTIVGESKGMGVFLDETSQGVIRLKTGEVHGGWILRSVGGRVASFERGDHQEAILALPPPGVEQISLGVGPDGTERVGIRGNDQIVGPAPMSAKPAAPPLPAATKGTFRRTPREL